MEEKKRTRFTRQEKSWVMYDWANSVYATIMMAAVYPIFFTAMVDGQLGDNMGTYWWGIGTSVAMIVTAVAAPIIGAIADYKGYKRKLFILFLALGCTFTLVAAFAEVWWLMLVGYAVSHIGFNASCLVYDSFLTDVTTPERMDKVSSFGYAMGYIGGSTIPFLAAIAFTLTIGENDMGLAIKLSLILTVLWWAVFSIPFLKNIKQEYWIEKPQKSAMKETFKAVGRTASKIFKNKKIFFFIIAYFFYIDGVGTVIGMSTSYGTTLGLDTTGMILALLVTQIVGMPCAILFSRLSKRFGSLRMLTVAVCIYLTICVIGFLMGFGLEQSWFGTGTALILFWTLAVMVGTVQGGIQAISRSHFGRLVPPENSGEYFGFFDIFGKFAAVLGPLLYAFISRVSARSSFGILSIVFLFLVALVILGAKRRIMQK